MRLAEEGIHGHEDEESRDFQVYLPTYLPTWLASYLLKAPRKRHVRLEARNRAPHLLSTETMAHENNRRGLSALALLRPLPS